MEILRLALAAGVQGTCILFFCDVSRDLIGIEIRVILQRSRTKRKSQRGPSCFVFPFFVPRNNKTTRLRFSGSLAKKADRGHRQSANHNAWKRNADTEYMYEFVSRGMPLCRIAWTKLLHFSARGSKIWLLSHRITGSWPLVWRPACSREGSAVVHGFAKISGDRERDSQLPTKNARKDRCCQRFRWVEEFDLDPSFSRHAKRGKRWEEFAASWCQLPYSHFPHRRHMPNSP
jgi:hypothetical protein